MNTRHSPSKPLPFGSVLSVDPHFGPIVGIAVTLQNRLRSRWILTWKIPSTVTAIVLVLSLDSPRWAPVRDCILDALSLNEFLYFGPWVAWQPTLYRAYGGVVDACILPWSGGVWRKSSMVTSTARIKTTRKKTGAASPLLSSCRLRVALRVLQEPAKPHGWGKSVTVDSESLPLP